MGLYTTSYGPRSEAYSAERKKQWDPSDTLGIINTDPGYQCITCIGYAPSQRRRCRNPIRADNRQLITATLNEIAYLRPDSPAVASRLRTIVGAALCVRYHQNQAEEVLQQWQERIRQAKPRISKPVPTKPVQSAARQDAKRDQALEDAHKRIREMSKLLAQLQEDLRRQQQKDRADELREKHKARERQEEEDLKRQRRKERDQEARRQEAERQEKERREKEEEEEEEDDDDDDDDDGDGDDDDDDEDEEEYEEEDEEDDERREAEEELRKKEQQEKERREFEQSAREQKARERAAENERIRQKADRIREERERKERKKAQQEREEWDQLWVKYQERWAEFKAPKAAREGNIRDAIPWPVRSGIYGDVAASNVKEFLETAVPRNADAAKLMRKECQKWHPDMVNSWLRGAELTEVDRIMVGMICRVVTDLLNKAAGRSSEFLG